MIICCLFVNTLNTYPACLRKNIFSAVKMRLNQYTTISGSQIYLVPYRKKHVNRYHLWMASEELQTLTASEPLTLDQEYEMEENWRNDPDKCTFIILDKNQFDEKQDEVQAMIGDTNIFLKNVDGHYVAELEIMIAEPSARGKGMGKEAVLTMLRYGIENLNIKIYEAKILIENEKSILLFQKIGFQKTYESNVFNEITLEKKVTADWLSWLRTNTSNYSLMENVQQLQQ